MQALAPVRITRTFHGLTPSDVYAVIIDFEAYPNFFPEVRSARILEREGNRVRCEFRLQVVVPVRYVLDLECDPERLLVHWRLVEGDIVRENCGRWIFSAIGGEEGCRPEFVPANVGTRVEYEVALSVQAPVPGFVLRRIVEGLVALSLPAMLSALEREVRRRVLGCTTGTRPPA